MYRRCAEPAAKYIGISETQWRQLPAVAWTAYPEWWAVGARRVRCAVYCGGAKPTKSVKGSKGKGSAALVNASVMSATVGGVPGGGQG